MILNNNIISLEERGEYIRLKAEKMKRDKARQQAISLWEKSNRTSNKLLQLQLRSHATNLIMDNMLMEENNG